MDDAGLPTPSPDGKKASNSNKTTIGVLIALVVVLTVAGIGVATVRDATETIRRATSTTTSVVSGGTVLPPSDLTAEQQQAVEEVKAQIAAVRGLEWKGPLPIKVLTKEDLAQRVRALNAEEIAENREDIDAAEAVLKLLKLIPEDLDYATAFDDILAGGVLGYYDDEAKELFVGGLASGPLDPPTRSVLAHELVHALTDQHFDFGAKTEILDDEDRTEEAAAFSALLEGDAELTRTIWEQEHLSDRERLQAAIGGSADVGTYANAPQYLLESLFFPYQDGLAFVRSRHRAGGFAEVDNAYRSPPTSTEHILHPETYAAGQGSVSPQLPDLAAATGCGLVDTGAIGEFDMAQLLAAEISGTDARSAAEGWNGDSYTVVRCGTALGLADRWHTDTPDDAADLADALGRWARGWSGSTRGPDAQGRFTGPMGSGRVQRDGSRIDIVLADDLPTADRLAGALTPA